MRGLWPKLRTRQRLWKLWQTAWLNRPHRLAVLIVLKPMRKGPKRDESNWQESLPKQFPLKPNRWNRELKKVGQSLRPERTPLSLNKSGSESAPNVNRKHRKNISHLMWESPTRLNFNVWQSVTCGTKCGVKKHTYACLKRHRTPENGIEIATARKWGEWKWKQDIRAWSRPKWLRFLNKGHGWDQSGVHLHKSFPGVCYGLNWPHVRSPASGKRNK